MNTSADVVARRFGSSARSELLVEFEQVYRAHVGLVGAFFARRCAEPYTVADLTSETFVQAIGSFATFDASRGTSRAWLFGVARRVYARHCAEVADGRDAAIRYAARRVLEDDELEELVAKIDAERAGRELIERWTRLPAIDRDAVELVDLAGLTPKEAALAMRVSPGAMRVRLFRARARLRKEHAPNG